MEKTFQIGDKVWFFFGHTILDGVIRSLEATGLYKIEPSKENKRLYGDFFYRGSRFMFKTKEEAQVCLNRNKENINV